MLVWWLSFWLHTEKTALMLEKELWHVIERQQLKYCLCHMLYSYFSQACDHALVKKQRKEGTKGFQEIQRTIKHLFLSNSSGFCILNWDHPTLVFGPPNLYALLTAFGGVCGDAHQEHTSTFLLSLSFLPLWALSLLISKTSNPKI